MTTPTEIRSTHPYAFRSGEWGRVLYTTYYHGRLCYAVYWPEERLDHRGKPLRDFDYLPVEDPSDKEREYR